MPMTNAGQRKLGYEDGMLDFDDGDMSRWEEILVALRGPDGFAKAFARGYVEGWGAASKAEDINTW